VSSDERPFDLRDLLKSIADANWEISDVQRLDDNGLDRITAAASARVPDSIASSLHRTVREVSKAGLKIDVVDLDYSPERNLIEAAKDRLREKVYTLAQAEAEKLNKLMQNAISPWRVGSVDFGRNDLVSPKATRSAAYESTAFAVAAPAGGALSEPLIDTAYKVGLTATVRLTRSVVV
jgi:hypothetical protein